jgi:class 3 adenylate cyclase
MEPQVRYARTADGISIAYWMIGEGEAVVDMGQPPATHIQMEWRIAPIRSWYERFAHHARFIRFDTRGIGLSERDVQAYSADTLVADLESVVDALALSRFHLIGQINSAPGAIAYAARHPDRVARLILWCGYSRGPEFYGDPGTQALREMVDRDWHMLTDTASRSRFGWQDDEHARDIAALWRATVSPRVMAMMMDTLKGADVSGLLPQVQAPTLVLQREKRGADVARRIAAGIPDAAVAMFEGASAAQYLRDADDVWRHIAHFLGYDATVHDGSRGSVRTVLFTDLVGHTEMMQRLGDESGRAVLREHERITRELLKQYGGAEVKTMGDGFLASFSSVTRAIDCAIALQQAIASATLPASLDGEGLGVRCGLNAGEPIEEDGDLFGSTVIMASRVAAQAGAGEILIPEPLRHLLAGKSYAYADRGETMLKGFEDAVRLYEVRWRG